MRERPILFSDPMVRAVLSGTKTQTRRVVNPQPVFSECGGCFYPSPEHKRGKHYANARHFGIGFPLDFCPYGQPGDRLYVREAWAEVGTCDPGLIVYRADYPNCVPRQYENVPPASEIRWRPSIHQRREHSRILLEIVAVRVERLNDISEADAQAEGCCLECMTPTGDDSGSAIYGPHGYIDLWESINGAGSWAANPWVWVVEFKKVPQ